VSYMDAQAGVVIKALKENGLDDNTIVVFCSDHGYLLGHHHKYQKQHLFEESTRVPFIVRVPWLKNQHGKQTQKITELIDLYPTLADLAGLKAPKTLQGSSLQTLLKDPNSSSWNKDMAFTISRSGGESIKTKRFRFTQWGFGSAGYELFDLAKDTGEFTNQAANPEYKPVLEKLKKQLLAKRIEAGFNDSFIKKSTKKKKKK
ncbi:MAG: sulfatase-like hydrolase/transferase, partial [Lentisphaeraceae bacterium]|nr:sulfatase-like hydrolase/transferase [Lentisphaeraceae bacterium]